MRNACVTMITALPKFMQFSDYKNRVAVHIDSFVEFSWAGKERHVREKCTRNGKEKCTYMRYSDFHIIKNHAFFKSLYKEITASSEMYFLFSAWESTRMRCSNRGIRELDAFFRFLQNELVVSSDNVLVSMAVKYSYMHYIDRRFTEFYAFQRFL